MKFYIAIFFENFSRKFMYSYNLTRITRRQYMFLKNFRWILIRMRSTSDNRYRGNHTTHFMFDVFCFSENRVVYKVMWQNTVQSGYRWKYGAYALHAGSVRLQTHTQNMQNFLLFHGNNGYEKEAQYACWVLRTFPVPCTNKQLEEE